MSRFFVSSLYRTARIANDVRAASRQMGVVCDPCRVQWPCDTERLIAKTFGEIPRGTPGNLLQPGEIEGSEA